MRRTDPLILGGGPAGAATAIALALGGASATVIERTRTPHDVVCGAFLGWDAISSLTALGLNPWALGAHPIVGVRILAGRRRVERRLPGAAGLSRRALDAALLARAEALGVDVVRGIGARTLDGATLHLSDGRRMKPETLFLATGKHSLRGSPRVGAVGRHVGLRAALPGTPELAGWIELHLLDGGYAGLLLQEDGRSNVCLSITGERLAAVGSPARLIEQLRREAPAFGARLGDGEPEWAAVSGVPYGWRTGETRPGLFRVGDQAGVIASLAGDGLAIALASGRAAAAAWLGGGADAAPAFQRRFAARARRPVRPGRSACAMPPSIPPACRRHDRRPGPRLPGLLQLAARLTRIGE